MKVNVYAPQVGWELGESGNVCNDLGAVMQVCGGVMGSFGRQSEEDLQKRQGHTGG